MRYGMTERAERIVAIGNTLCKGSGFLFYAFVLLGRL